MPVPLALSVVATPLHILNHGAAVVLVGAGKLMVLTVNTFDVNEHVVTESVVLVAVVLNAPNCNSALKLKSYMQPVPVLKRM